MLILNNIKQEKGVHNYESVTFKAIESLVK